MAPSQYERIIAKAVPISFQGQAVRLEDFLMTTRNINIAIEPMQTIKKNLFCENGYCNSNSNMFSNNCCRFPSQFEDYNKGVKTLNAVLSIVIESKNLLQTLEKTFENSRFDSDNKIKEYASNIFQHLAILCDATETTFEELQNQNIEKLKNIFPIQMEKVLQLEMENL